MPMLRIKGIPMDIIKSISHTLVDDLHQIIGCPRDYFTLEIPQSTFIFDKDEVNAPTIIEVAWFDRGQDVQDKAALCITHHFSPFISDLEVYFIPLEEKNYYENGTHF